MGQANGVPWHFISLSCLAQNAYIERFNGASSPELTHCRTGTPVLPSLFNDLIDRISTCNRKQAAEAILAMSPLLVWVHGRDAIPGIRDEITYCLKHRP